MILAVEAGIFPLMCGWWIDLCSFVSGDQLYFVKLNFVNSNYNHK